MKIYLLCDMEGTSGIWRVEQTQRGSDQYREGQELLCADVNAAIAGAIDGGATEVVVCDTHGAGNNFLLEKTDPRARYETPAPPSLMPSLDETFAGLILLGHHARAGTINGFLDHTMSSASWFRFSINDIEVGEIGLETAFAGHYNVPLIMVSGDEATGAETQQLFPGVVTVAVKRGLGRQRASCLHPKTAQELIRAGAAGAVKKARQLKPWKPSPPMTVTLELYRSDMADDLAARPGVERVNARTIRKTVATALDVVRF